MRMMAGTGTGAGTRTRDENECEGRNGGENRSGNGDENMDEGGGEIEPGNLRSGDGGIRGGIGDRSEDAERGGRSQRVISDQSCKTRRPSETVASCGGA